MRMIAVLLLGMVLFSCAAGSGNSFYIPVPQSPPFPPTDQIATTYTKPPKLVRQKLPKYPAYAFEKKIEGVVRLEILIDETGAVSAWRVLRSIPELDGAAVECVRTWLFEPAERNGVPVATIATAPVTFRIY